MPRRKRRKGWRHEASTDVWVHDPTGLRFSGPMAAHYGWASMNELCVEIIGWRQFIAALPETNMRQQRERLLADALACDDDEAMRALTLRWTLWHQECNATTTGGTNDAGR